MALGDRICSVEGCDRRILARGLCTNHYQQWWQSNRRARSTFNGELKTITDYEKITKRCPACGLIKPISAYGLRKDRVRSWCLKCEASKAKAASHAKGVKHTWYPKGTPQSHKTKVNKLRNRYNLTLDDYNNMLSAQDFKCKICGRPFPDTPTRRGDIPHLDHDHRTGALRGILCTKCNTALGMVDENISTLLEMIRYLNEYQD